jgi:hypothetical protein
MGPLTCVATAQQQKKRPPLFFVNLRILQAEEVLRLRLYSDITSRMQDAMAVLEAKAMARRRAQGWVESRPLH